MFFLHYSTRGSHILQPHCLLRLSYPVNFANPNQAIATTTTTTSAHLAYHVQKSGRKTPIIIIITTTTTTAATTAMSCYIKDLAFFPSY